MLWGANRIKTRSMTLWSSSSDDDMTANQEPALQTCALYVQLCAADAENSVPDRYRYTRGVRAWFPNTMIS